MTESVTNKRLPDLDLSTLHKAWRTLDKALAAYDSDKGNEFIRDACIQRFEYCYTLAVRMIDRHLAIAESDPAEVREMTFQDRIRRAHRIGIIPSSWDVWWKYRDNRAATSHGYDENRAKAIFESIPEFAHEIRVLLDRLADIHGAET